MIKFSKHTDSGYLIRYTCQFYLISNRKSMLLIQFRKTGDGYADRFLGTDHGDRKHRHIGKHTYGIKIRDLVRKTAFGINFSVIGIENQSNIDYTFPVRAMSYDVENTRGS